VRRSEAVTPTTDTEQLCFENVSVGQEIELRITPSTQQLVHWAAGSGDFNPIHYDEESARSTGLPGVIMHGALKHALLGRMLWEWIRYEGQVIDWSVSYRGMDYPGHEFICRGQVTGKRREGDEHLVDLELWTENPEGKRTTPGTATVALPARG
jgi:acyl dehydratase